jgi:hypothetical protein
MMLGVFFFFGLVFYTLTFGPGLRDIRGIAYQPTDDPARVRVEVGGTLFAVPAQFTRNAQTRRGVELSHAELHALLPDFEPWDDDLADRFLQTDSQSALLTITLRAISRAMPEAQMFDALYKPYIVGTGTVRDDRLQLFQFRSDGPYAKKQIFRGLTTGTQEARISAPIFICDLPDAPSPTCESRFDIGNTAQASYRFKRAHLSDWANTDQRIKELIRNFRAAARSTFSR